MWLALSLHGLSYWLDSPQSPKTSISSADVVSRSTAVKKGAVLIFFDKDDVFFNTGSNYVFATNPKAISNPFTIPYYHLPYLLFYVPSYFL